jgi:hypothetical protein
MVFVGVGVTGNSVLTSDDVGVGVGVVCIKSDIHSNVYVLKSDAHSKVYVRNSESQTK